MEMLQGLEDKRASERKNSTLFFVKKEKLQRHCGLFYKSDRMRLNHMKTKCLMAVLIPDKKCPVSHANNFF